MYRQAVCVCVVYRRSMRFKQTARVFLKREAPHGRRTLTLTTATVSTSPELIGPINLFANAKKW